MFWLIMYFSELMAKDAIRIALAELENGEDETIHDQIEHSPWLLTCTPRDKDDPALDQDRVRISTVRGDIEEETQSELDDCDRELRKTADQLIKSSRKSRIPKPKMDKHKMGKVKKSKLPGNIVEVNHNLVCEGTGMVNNTEHPTSDTHGVGPDRDATQPKPETATMQLKTDKFKHVKSKLYQARSAEVKRVSVENSEPIKAFTANPKYQHVKSKLLEPIKNDTANVQSCQEVSSRNSQMQSGGLYRKKVQSKINTGILKLGVTDERVNPYKTVAPPIKTKKPKERKSLKLGVCAINAVDPFSHSDNLMPHDGLEPRPNPFSSFAPLPSIRPANGQSSNRSCGIFDEEAFLLSDRDYKQNSDKHSNSDKFSVLPPIVKNQRQFFF